MVGLQEEKQTVKRSKCKELLFILLLFVLTIPVLWVAQYARPVADDYDYSWMVYQEIQENGVTLQGLVSSAMETNAEFYQNWQGLYTSAFILALQPGIFGAEYYGVTTIILVALIFVTFFAIFKLLLPEIIGQSPFSPLLLASLFSFMIVQDMPSPLEGLYWHNGAVNYLPFCLLTLLNLTLVYKMWRSESKKMQGMLLVISMLLSFVISGGNHVTSFLNILCLIALSGVGIYLKKYGVVLSLMVACGGFAVMMMAPGTAVRADRLEGHGVVESIIMALYHGAGTSYQWANRGWVCFLLLLTPFCWAFIKENRFGLTFRYPLLPVGASICLVSAMFCVPYYAGSFFGAGRLQNVIWIVYLVLSAGCYTYFLGWANNHVSFAVSCKGWVKQYGCGMLALLAVGCIMISGNDYPQIARFGVRPGTSLLATIDLLRGTAQGYAAQVDERIALCEDPTVSIVQVAPLSDQPYTLYFSDLSEDVDDWTCHAISRYYGKSITLQPQEAQMDEK